MNKVEHKREARLRRRAIDSYLAGLRRHLALTGLPALRPAREKWLGRLVGPGLLAGRDVINFEDVRAEGERINRVPS